MLLASRVASALGASELGRELALAGDGLAWYALRPFPGYAGRPHLASAEAGAVFAREIVSLYASAARDVSSADVQRFPADVRPSTAA